MGGEALVLDLADLDAVTELALDVDILVNNAGLRRVTHPRVPARAVFTDPAGDARAPFRLIRSALPAMYGRNWGRIINISSVHGLVASPYKAAYVSAKHGLEGLSKVVALEGAAHGVTSNCINPGYVRTPLVESQIAAQSNVHGIPEQDVIEKILLARSYSSDSWSRPRLPNSPRTCAHLPRPSSPERRFPWTVAGRPTELCQPGVPGNRQPFLQRSSRLCLENPLCTSTNRVSLRRSVADGGETDAPVLGETAHHVKNDPHLS